MGLAKFEIVAKGSTWRLRRKGKKENRYATKGAAFEAAIAAASIALQEGHDVTMTAAPSETTPGGPAN
ncbi:hypothetical protein GGD66_006429 [Bradyrhizobium sp. CIR48]|uniref:hypothetical protein n=1 Tax=Bradyrhizobium sp. CIR48 TaxID=2663840 RepID=UPI001606780A|nr:hypothetical protein [Bradyrhizobium sp. CIR48]MBB4427846.1 hypothetical protein [Bradyrhizobium sp. CIR48]